MPRRRWLDAEAFIKAAVPTNMKKIFKAAAKNA